MKAFLAFLMVVYDPEWEVWIMHWVLFFSMISFFVMQGGISTTVSQIWIVQFLFVAAAPELYELTEHIHRK